MLQRGQSLTDGVALMAEMRSISMPGVVTETVKLTPEGELDTPYVLYNFNIRSTGEGRWNKVATWNTTTQKFNFMGPIPGCECTGWTWRTGIGGTPADRRGSYCSAHGGPLVIDFSALSNPKIDLPTTHPGH